MEVYFDRKELERTDFVQCCLFTGEIPAKLTEEHVIPKWMLSANCLNDKRIEMGSRTALARMKEFRAAAEFVENQFFGNVENRVKQCIASTDEIHLWHKKISAGLTVAHWRLARNTNNPRAPSELDEAALPIVLRDFQSDYAAFKQGSYHRTGSTISLKSPLPDGWLAHVVGGLKQDAGVVFHHRPYALVATSIHGVLHVSILHDSAREFEARYASEDWAIALATCNSSPRMHAALAVMLTDLVDKWLREMNGGSLPESMFPMIAYQLGIEIRGDGTWGVRQA
ncbi:hypothetical protein [Stenotrophomonas maltophilia]|uniref:hypothetical protein n=1 Tax=Stenotrophomonas maltophilia TaxID=40324 RepID=UPI002E778F0E|nr:hypothetical protein [Stenotrophomonas maltophilia]